MSAQYSIVSIRKRNKYDPDLSEAVEGHDVTAKWAATGDVLTVFVPGVDLDPTDADTMIRQAGYKREQVRALGGGA